MPLTVGGLVGAGVYALFIGLWAPVLLTIALTHVADFDPREKRLAFGLTLAAFSAIFQPASSLDLCPHSRILGIVGIWHPGRRRCETIDRCDTCLRESNCSDPHCGFRGNPGRNCKPTKEERDSFCRIDILWNLVVCCLSIFLKRKEVIGFAFPKR